LRVSKTHELLHGIRAGHVPLTMMGLSLPSLNTCLAKDATREGAC
jgi:hypothetical protein